MIVTRFVNQLFVSPEPKIAEDAARRLIERKAQELATWERDTPRYFYLFERFGDGKP